MYYILDRNGDVQSCTVQEWVRWFGVMENGRIRKTLVGDVTVFTAFLGMDHNSGNGPPLLFGTIVFGGELNEEMECYSAQQEAVEGHAKMVLRVRRGLNHDISS